MSVKTVPESELLNRIRADNLWWRPPHQIHKAHRDLPERAYFDLFFPLVPQRDPRRALILMGPRRVGKTVVLYQAIQKLIDDGVDPKRICYLDLQTPLYNGIPLERLLDLAKLAAERTDDGETFTFFDEVQYLPQWELHLKNLVDTRPLIKFIASGSAAAALKLKSVESGAGRFTDFLMPPVTFYEYLQLLGIDNYIDIQGVDGGKWQVGWESHSIGTLNEHFFDYLNVGGYPEAIFSETIQSDMGRYIRSDIIDKVLMKDLPSLYGIHDIQELNSLFTMLAYNTANEVSLDSLSQNAGVAKNTIKKYIEYLESAFLVKVLHRVDRSAKRFKKANFFKVYLTNPSIRSALFAPVGPEDDAGHLVETAIFSQWMHSTQSPLYYARWDKGAGEVDLVYLSEVNFQPTWALEVKWSDSYLQKPKGLNSLHSFLKKHPGCAGLATTRTVSEDTKLASKNISLWPSSVYCYWIGWNIIRRKKDATLSVSLFPQDARSSS